VLGPAPKPPTPAVHSGRAEALSEVFITGIGVVVPGAVEHGVVRYAANLPLREVDLRARLEAVLDLPVAVGHDVAAAAEAEAAATGVTDVLFVALGTGVAAAHVRDGRADRGATGQAGELGHLVVVPGGEPCTCGNRGCVEVYASAAAVARRYKELTGMSDADAAYVASVTETDRQAGAVWAEAVDSLAAGITAAVMLLDPAVVLLGGGLSGAGDRLLEPVRKAVAERCTWRAAPPLRLGVLGAAAGRHGAARLARELADTIAKERRS
jgi:glucokinase